MGTDIITMKVCLNVTFASHSGWSMSMLIEKSLSFSKKSCRQGSESSRGGLTLGLRARFGEERELLEESLWGV